MDVCVDIQILLKYKIRLFMTIVLPKQFSQESAHLKIVFVKRIIVSELDSYL